MNLPKTLSMQKPLPTAANNVSEISRWFRVFQPCEKVQQRLFCFSHAGGSASFFRHWAKALPANIELVAIQYPGREERISEPAMVDMKMLTMKIARNLMLSPALLAKPCIFFGHSMGAVVAYEVYRALQSFKAQLPKYLVLSASEGPSRHRQGNLFRAHDNELKQELFRLGGTSPTLMQFPELAELILPSMRADYQAIETYSPDVQRTPVLAPITILTGASDTELQAGDAQAWEQETSGAFDVRSFPGGHFYLIEQQQAVIRYLLTRFQHIAGARSTGSWPNLP